MSLSPVSRFFAAALVVAASIGCSAADATTAVDKSPKTLVVVQGAEQSAQAGRDLPQLVQFRVLDASGGAVQGATVSLSVVTGGGAVTPASDTTDARGEFKAKWTLGPAVVAQAISAEVRGVNPVTVHATAILPARIVVVQGQGQSAKAGAALVNSVIVRVVSEGNMPMQGVTVGFQITGGGAMAPATVVTNVLGEASTKWTLGPVGAHSAIAVAGPLTSAQITATATP